MSCRAAEQQEALRWFSVLRVPVKREPPLGLVAIQGSWKNWLQDKVPGICTGTAETSHAFLLSVVIRALLVCSCSPLTGYHSWVSQERVRVAVVSAVELIGDWLLTASVLAHDFARTGH